MRKVLIEKCPETPEIDIYGNCFWKNNLGELHRGYDEPAIIMCSGDMYWFQNDRCHRDGNKPAVIRKRPSEINLENTASAQFEYRINGNLHRDGDKPAVIWFGEKQKAWFKNGKMHREKGPALMSEKLDLWFNDDVEIKKEYKYKWGGFIIKNSFKFLITIIAFAFFILSFI